MNYYESQDINIDYRKQHDSLIQQGIDHWLALGCTLNSEQQEKIFLCWHHTEQLRSIADFDFFNQQHSLIDQYQKDDQWLQQIVDILKSAPLQAGETDYNDKTLLAFLLTLFGTFIPLEKLLQEVTLEAWMERFSANILSYLLQYRQEVLAVDAILPYLLKMQSPRAMAWVVSSHYNALKQRIKHKQDNEFAQQFYTLSEQLFERKPDIFKHVSEMEIYDSPLISMTKSATILMTIIRQLRMKKDSKWRVISNIIEHYDSLCQKDISLLNDWSEFTELAQQSPDYFTYRIAVGGGIPELFWHSGDSEQMQAGFRQYFFLLQQDYDIYLAKINQCIQNDETLCRDALEMSYYRSPFGSLDDTILERLLTEPEAIFSPYILNFFGNYCDSGYRYKCQTMLSKVVQDYPDFLEMVSGRTVAYYLDAESFKDEDVFKQADSALRKIVNRSKSGQEALAKLFSGKKAFNIELLTDWTVDRKKKIRDFAYECIIKSKQPPLELLQRMSANKKYSTEQRGQIHQLIAKQGGQVDSSNSVKEKTPETLAELLEQAAKEKFRKKKLYNDLWDEQYTEQLKPLNEAAVRWLLSLLADMGKEKTTLPLLAQRLLAHVSDRGQKEFAKTLLEHWLANNATISHIWLIPVLGQLGSNELIEPLFHAVNNWRKGTDQNKGVRCLTVLGLLDNNHALSCVYDVYSKKGYGYSLYAEANTILSCAAKSRNIARADLYDQLLPDFGLSAEGLLLDAGVRSYRLNIGQDLNLKITNLDSGRITKTLPKAKKDEDPKKRAVIEEQYKYLKRNIKKVAKQQAQRMEEAAVVGRSWPYSQWQILFLQHPLLVIMGQSLIWQRLDKEKQFKGTFRITEDLSLIDNEDELVTIDASESITLWHPVHDTEASLAAWQEHLADYELNPIVDQLNLPRHQLLADEGELTTLTRFKGSKLTTSRAKQLLNKWGYESSGCNDSSYSDLWDKFFTLTGWSVTIEFEDFRIFNEYDEQVNLSQFTFNQARSNDVKLKDVPKGIIAMAIEQGLMIKAMK